MNLKEIRKKHNLTQMQTARLIGVSFNTYIRWESMVVVPNEENQIKLDNFLKGLSNNETDISSL